MTGELKIQLEILEVFWVIDGEILCVVVQIGGRILSNLVYEKGA